MNGILLTYLQRPMNFIRHTLSSIVSVKETCT